MFVCSSVTRTIWVRFPAATFIWDSGAVGAQGFWAAQTSGVRFLTFPSKIQHSTIGLVYSSFKRVIRVESRCWNFLFFAQRRFTSML